MPKLHDAPHRMSHRFALALAFAAPLLVGACDKKDESGGGSSPTTATPSTPAAVPADQIAFADGMYFKSADGTVKAWGYVDLLPDTPEEQRGKPTVVPELANTKRLAVGGDRTMCAVMNDGTAKCWGNGASGQFGDGKEGESKKPVVVPGVANAEAIAMADSYLCALIGDGTVKCWGNNQFNQVSVEEKKTLVTPTTVPDVTDVQQIATGAETSCALGKDGSVKCWGLDCGAAGPNLCTKPFTVESLAGATNIMAGWQTICAVAKDSTVQCWGGNNEVGQLGTGDTESPDTGKITAVKGLTGAKELAAGQQHWCALMQDKTVQCWGSNEYGQLGDGQSPEAEKFRPTPAPVKGVAGAISLTCNGGSCCVQLEDKSVKCWGENNTSFGEANNETTNVATPVAVPVN